MPECVRGEPGYGRKYHCASSLNSLKRSGAWACLDMRTKDKIAERSIGSPEDEFPLSTQAADIEVIICHHLVFLGFDIMS